MVKIGEEVPDFEVDAYYENDIKKIKLSNYKGKWVVMLFYPADFTFVCPTELTAAADDYETFKAMETEVMSVSVDTAFAHKAWHDNSESIKKITYPMLADPTGNLCREFGTYIEHEGLSLRGSFIINPEGVLISSDVHDNSIGRSTKEILRKLKAAQFVAKHNGQVCPANWDEGKETLTPGVDLVGKL